MSQTKPSRFLMIGVGGKKCACCFPAPGSKERKAAYRSAKRQSNREAKREMIAEVVFAS